MTAFAAISGYLGAGAFGILVLLLLVAARSNPIGRILILASTTTAIWFLLQAANYHFAPQFGISVTWIRFFELSRNATWLLFLGKLVSLAGDETYQRRVLLAGILLGGLIILSAALILFPYESGRVFDADPTQIRKLFSPL